MDSQQTPINRQERRRSRRSRAAERASSWLDEWVFIRGGDLVSGLFARLRRGGEGLTWALRRYLVWPLQDRLGGLGAPGRVLAAVAAALVVGVGVAAVLSASSGDGGTEPAAAEVAVAVAEPPAEPAPKPAEPEAETETLQGAAPVFKPSKETKKSAKVQGDSAAIASAPAGADPATTRIGSKPGAATSSATSPSATQSAVGIDGPPAGEKALAVAEDFAGAFVLYETGGKKQKVRKAFATTATPELTKSLMSRPPRQPANVEVPEARVVNVVAGPSHGGVYSVSVSLLRVGLTSELRLDMEKHKDEWLVTNVLG
jgi:hypothetical protein